MRIACLLFAVSLLAPAFIATARAAPGDESVQDAVCRLIDQASAARSLPADFLTRLIWRESSFRSHVVSPAGAQGIAQFMPGTAKERGLQDPFDPEKAIPASAHLLDELRTQFGNLGLAAAAYNAGPTRVRDWMAGTRGLPLETQTYVRLVTGREAEAWLDAKDAEPKPDAPKPTCATTVASLGRVPADSGGVFAPISPWGVQLAGNFSKARALSSFHRAASSYAPVIGSVQPMIIGTRLRSRGSRAFYRVRVPAQTRKQAETLCNRIRAVGGACLVLAS
jgi:hypothetical protein